jgi:hypothetical protein
MTGDSGGVFGAGRWGGKRLKDGPKSATLNGRGFASQSSKFKVQSSKFKVQSSKFKFKVLGFKVP